MKLADINFKFFYSFEGELVCIKLFYPYKQMLCYSQCSVTKFSKKEIRLEGAHPHLLNPQHSKAARNYPDGLRGR